MCPRISPVFPRYLERNSVRADIVESAEDYEFSSARAHVYKKKDRLLSDNFVNEEIKDWKAFLEGDDMEQDVMLFKKHARVGRPLGQEGFTEKLEKMTGRILKPQKPGRNKTK